MSEPTFAAMAINSAEQELKEAEAKHHLDSHGAIAERYAIAVDLDGTLAEYHGWQGVEHIGKPVPAMVEKVKKAHAEGKEIYIFTARVSDPVDAEEAYKAIKYWADLHNVPHVGITATKHKFFKEFWDDRAVQVMPNTGGFLGEVPAVGLGNLTDQLICEQLGITEKALKVARLMSLPVFNYQHGGSHYKDMLIEPAVYVAANKLGAEEGNVIKYTSRHPFKNGEQDVDKAIHNLQMIKETRY